MSATSRWRGLPAFIRPSLLAVLATALGAAGMALAADASSPGDAKVSDLLKARLPKTKLSQVACGKIEGLCEVTAGANLFYVDHGARYLIIGRVYDMQTRQDLTAARLLEINPDMLVGGAAKANGQSVTEAKNEALCTAATNGKTCELTSETCIDPTPTTRVINGVPVTRACWGWSRSYTCNAVTSGNDCSTLAANPKCSYLRDECLDDPDEGGGACKTVEKIYKCETPHGASPDTNQYICGDDVYCINGDCEPIVREASTEFKDALVALHSIDQAGKEFDETNFSVFKGKRETCHKPVFGLINCCAGKVSGVVPVAAGAAALAGGPAAIAAFATPFLTMFACSQSEMQLDIKDRMGFCHKVGTYCSSSFLGICKTKRTAYCCFESKLSRVLQEQGRVQLGKPWGSPKNEQCNGFTIEEFASLDLSIMDFTEVYADFMDAAKLPDEVETMSEIQGKIQDYYDLHGK